MLPGLHGNENALQRLIGLAKQPKTIMGLPPEKPRRKGKREMSPTDRKWLSWAKDVRQRRQVAETKVRRERREKHAENRKRKLAA